jgi:XTP/dITP diphosphohydrolase
MKELIFATNNTHKLEEVAPLLEGRYIVKSLAEIGCTEDIPETANTLQGNALQKAVFVHEKYGLDCFSDDTGLEIEALNNAPGVYSARYAGEQRCAADNLAKVLQEMSGVKNRNARFCTVIALILEGKTYFFEGEVKGTIIRNPIGTKGFGYDPIFIPEGYDKTFAELDLAIKNTISHRARAVQKLITFLSQNV